VNGADLGNMAHDIAGDLSVAEGDCHRIASFGYANETRPLTREDYVRVQDCSTAAANLRDELREMFYDLVPKKERP
jgi:hypothetical protein